MNLDYVFGPVKATDNLLNANLEFLRVADTQEKQRGWAWTSDEDFTYNGDCSGGSYDIDPMVVIDDLLRTLREELEEQVNSWLDRNPKAAADLDKFRANPSQYFQDRDERIAAAQAKKGAKRS